MTTEAIRLSQSKEILRGLTLLVILLPLFYFPNLINLYRLPKETLLAFLTAVLSWLWLLNSMRKGDRERPSLPLFITILLYLFFSGLSLSNATNLYEGARHLLNLALGITLFWITANHMDRESAPFLLRWAAITGAVVSFVGIIQMWGGEIPALEQIARPSSTFGNKNMAAQYILFVIPVAFYLLLTSPDRTREWLYGVVAALITTYLIYTGTRAAWGAAVMASLLMWFCLRAKGFTPQQLLFFSRRQWYFLLAILVFSVAMNTIPRYFIADFGISPPITRLQSMLETEKDASAQSRFAFWANSLAIFKDRPLLGAGIGNFRLIYPLYNRRAVKDPSFSVEQKAGEAHNDYVQSLAETGLLGTGLFVAILLVLGGKIWQSITKEKLDPLLLAVSYALIAILLEAFWDFPFKLPVPSAFFWIYAGLMWVVTGDNPRHPPPRKISLPIIFFLSLCATVASIWTFTHLRAEFFYSRPSVSGYPGLSTKETYDEAENDLTRAIQIYPYDYYYFHWLAYVKMRQGKGAEAVQANLRALSLNPFHINTLNNLGVTYTSLGNYSKAIQAYEVAIRIWPDYVTAHNNLGQVYERIGNKEKAIGEFQASLRIDPKNKLAMKKLATLLNEK
jgi:O-antigen ligase